MDDVIVFSSDGDEIADIDDNGIVWLKSGPVIPCDVRDGDGDGMWMMAGPDHLLF